MRQLFLLLIILTAGIDSRAGRGSISGHVKSGTGKGLGSAIVRLSADGGWQFQVRGDSSGYFSITGLSARNYTAVIQRAGYESQRYLDLSVDAGANAHLRLDAALSPVDSLEARTTTFVYKRQPAWPIAPGHWTADGDDNRVSSARKVPSQAVAAVSPGKMQPAGNADPALAARAKAGPRLKTAAEIESGTTPVGNLIVAPARSFTWSDVSTASHDSKRSAAGSAMQSIASLASNSRALKAGAGRASGAIDALATPAAISALSTPMSVSTAASGEVYVEAEAKAGSLTCGEVNDFSKWTLWEDMSYRQLEQYQKTWFVRPEKRVSVFVKAVNGRPLPNADVALMQFGNVLWEARTDNTGRAELWYNLFDSADVFMDALSLRVRAGGAEHLMQQPKLFDRGTNVIATQFPCSNPQKIDLAFIVDATGSMGDEIGYLKAELRDIIGRISDSMPLTHVQTGAVFYRDRGDEYLVRSSNLTERFSITERFIGDNIANGGGDGPEAVEAALEAGLGLGWRSDATARLAFLVLDAPPHDDSTTFRRIEAQVRAYAAQGVRLIPVACSGTDKTTEYLLRAIALATNGTYLFLTDHSGIGGKHTAPTTDKFDVEYLNQLIYRVIHNFSTMPECEVQTLALVDSTGGGREGKAAAWRFYPNPTQDVLHVDHDEKSGYLYVSDISGKLLQRIAVDPGGHSTVDMKQFPAGTYSIRHVWGGDQEVAGKFIVQH